MKTKEQLIEFIQKQKVALIASVDEEGFPNMKAKFFQLNMENPKASIYFYNKGRFKYEAVMLTGIMEVLQDEEIKREIWRDGDTMYYKQGVSDPDYCVLKFTAERGRHYCNFINKT